MILTTNLPDYVRINTEEKTFDLSKMNSEHWIHQDIDLTTKLIQNVLQIKVSAPKSLLKQIILIWRKDIKPENLFLGDHWERSYGDLQWMEMQPDRIMPWYFMHYDGKRTDSYGVKTGCNSMCYWQADKTGFILVLDVRSGAQSLVLGDKTLHAADIIFRNGKEDETPFEAVSEFCKMLCEKPIMPSSPIYGVDDWYYCYGLNSEEKIIWATEIASELSDNNTNRPFSLIDAGWQASGETEGGPWIPSSRFGDMASLADKIKKIGCRPAIWIRPLLTDEDLPKLYFRSKRILDPSVPEVIEKIKADILLLKSWGYQMIKHDFTAFDMFDLWGFEMGHNICKDGVIFSDRSKTTAEIILNLYKALREAAGDSLILACNTIGHLTAGLAEIQRIGDDTSGKEWDRTRKMGINTLAFRMPQHKAFYYADGDCVGLTTAIPWEFNRQWMNLLAESSAPLLVSTAPDALGEEQKRAIKNAFSQASHQQPSGEPLDWLTNITPSWWKLNNKLYEFEWYE